MIDHDVTPPEAPPRLIFGVAEGSRALSELAWFALVRRWLARGRDGARHPVLVLPGLGAGDASTKPLRSLLAAVGYDVHGWGLGCNVGPTGRIIEGLDALLGTIRDRSGEPVRVIGQSLGGFLARELARRHPDGVDRIITLGSPVRITSPRQSRAHGLYDRYASRHLPEYVFERWTKAPQPAVPATSVYSRSDGVVRWEACRYPDGPLTENIEVHASHCGMGAHPAAVYAVLDRLAAPTDPWQKFTPPVRLRHYFPARVDRTA